MEVSILNSPDPACDEFITQSPEGRICHLPTWASVVVRAAGHRTFYLVARDSGQVRGVLPLTQVRNFLFGNRMVSQAFSTYGGLLTESDQTRDALFNRAVELAIELNCESIEFRNTKPLPYDLESSKGKVCMYLPLVNDPEELWQSFVPKIRNHVRKAEKSGIVSYNGTIELLEAFYQVYTMRLHELGTPAYPKKLMRTILEMFPENSRIFVVQLEDLAVGVGFTICHKGFVEIPWAATLTKYNKMCPNNLLYWSIIKHYCLANAKCFDFGRCTVESGTYRFKKQWGAKPLNLHYQYWVHPDSQLSILSPDNPKYQRKVQMWKKLPFWTTRLLGPYISKNLP
jgi:serine/alanine adding enzyme